jgi:hypothetical protein
VDEARVIERTIERRDARVCMNRARPLDGMAMVDRLGHGGRIGCGARVIVIRRPLIAAHARLHCAPIVVIVHAAYGRSMVETGGARPPQPATRCTCRVLDDAVRISEAIGRCPGERSPLTKTALRPY